MTTALDTRRTYSEEEIQIALACYAIESGREEFVVKLIEEEGFEPPPIATLRAWAYKSRREDYEQIKAAAEAHVRSQQGDKARMLGNLSMELAEQTALELRKRVAGGDLTVKELAAIYKSAMLATGISVDKAELLAGNPTSIVESRFADLRRGLEARGVEVIVEGEVVDEETVTSPEQLEPGATATPGPSE